MLPDSLAYYGSMEVYWHAIVLASALAGGVVFAWLFRIAQLPWKRGDKGGMWLVTALTLVFGTFISRGMYCYFKPETVDNGISDFFNFKKGGFTLFGAIFGAVIAVYLTKLILRKVKVAELLDALSPAAALVICIGRCASFFSHEDLGQVMDNEKFQCLPFAVYNESDGFWHTAVFSFEAAAAAVAFIVSVVVFVICYGRKKPVATGRTFVAFAAVFTAGQCLFESMRTDSVYLRTLGFVRFNQAFSAIVLFAFFIWMAVMAIKKHGFKIWMPVMWLAVAGCFALAFYKEFRLTSGTMVSSHIIMGICLLAICVCTLVLVFMSIKKDAEEQEAAVSEPESAPFVPDVPAEPEKQNTPAIEEMPQEPAIAAPVVQEPAVQEPVIEAPVIPEPEPVQESYSEFDYSAYLPEETSNYSTESNYDPYYASEDLESAYLNGGSLGDSGYSRPTYDDDDTNYGF